MDKQTLNIKLTFSRSNVRLIPSVYGIDLSMHDARIIAGPGAPGFPIQVLEIAIPEGKEVSKVSSRVLQTRHLTHTPTFVSPVREQGVSQVDHDLLETYPRKWVKPDQDMYDEVLKEMVHQTVWTVGTRVEGRVLVEEVAVRPIRYDEESRLELITKLEVTLALRQTKIRHPRVLRALSNPSWSTRRHLKAAKTVINPEVIEELHSLKIDDTVDPVSFVLGKRRHDSSDKSILPDSDPLGPSIPSPDIPVPEFILEPLPTSIDYLIITDDKSWDAASCSPVGEIGDLPTAFERLSEWKKDRGLRTHIAKVKDIVRGAYGDFTTGARDLQEIIRSFLKDFVLRHDTEWVLLGGTIDIIPTRHVCGSVIDGLFGFSRHGEVLQDRQLVWRDVFLGMRTTKFGKVVFSDPNNDELRDNHILTVSKTGQRIPYHSLTSPDIPDLYWYHTTDDTFSTFSSNRTEFIRIEGDPSVINTKMQWYKYENLIPSDLYYSSLYAPSYGIFTNRHDWDISGNKLYGQWSESRNLDGLDFSEDVYVGRAPVGDLNEAEIFIDKVITYEQADRRPADHHRFNKMLLVAELLGDIYGRGRTSRDPGDTIPPPEQRYSYDSANRRTILNVPVATVGVGFKIVSYLSESEHHVIPYDRLSSTSRHGWFFARSSTDLRPSIYEVNIFSSRFVIPVPTQWIVIYADVDEMTADLIMLDEDGVDGSIREQERIRELIAQEAPNINDILRLYSHERDMSTSAVSSASLQHLDRDSLRAGLDNGPHLVSLSGHGWAEGCCQLDATLMDSLSNADKTFIMFADSCYTNELDYIETISKKALVTPNAGAVAYIGYSRVGWGAIGPDLLLEFFNNFVRPGRHHLGELNSSRVSLASRHIDHAMYRWAGLAQNLMGDPEMPVYRDMEDLRIKYVANTRTRELHERNCQWVEKMHLDNRLDLEDKEWALANGYDGCAFCLNEYNTG